MQNKLIKTSIKRNMVDFLWYEVRGSGHVVSLFWIADLIQMGIIVIFIQFLERWPRFGGVVNAAK
jgi:hypothetical protein